MEHVAVWIFATTLSRSSGGGTGAYSLRVQAVENAMNTARAGTSRFREHATMTLGFRPVLRTESHMLAMENLAHLGRYHDVFLGRTDHLHEQSQCCRDIE